MVIPLLANQDLTPMLGNTALECNKEMKNFISFFKKIIKHVVMHSVQINKHSSGIIESLGNMA